jgi:hypothetical protein
MPPPCFHSGTILHSFEHQDSWIALFAALGDGLSHLRVCPQAFTL